MGKKKELTEEERIEKETKKENRKRKVIKVLKYIGTGAAAVGGIIAAGIAVLSVTKSDSDESGSYSSDPFYEPFADPDNPLYIPAEEHEIIDLFDDDEEYDYGEPDESYGADDYFDSRPWGYDNDGW